MASMMQDFTIDTSAEEDARNQISSFIDNQSLNTKIALVTSGGTSVPLEQKTVRFIDNFSTGSRGSELTENLLMQGYAVIFLSRNGSQYPFMRQLSSGDADSTLRTLAMNPNEYLAQVEVLANTIASATNNGSRLLNIGFTSIIEYIALLKVCCEGISKVGNRGMIILAAAVSDFYIPFSEMSKDKIQSNVDGLNISLKNVPKMLGLIKSDWAPTSMLVSFKLETNENVLYAKATQSLSRYKVDVVVANNIADYKKRVTLVTRDPNSTQSPCVLASSVVGTEVEPVEVANVSMNEIKLEADDSTATSIDIDLTRALIAAHEAFAQ